jgi:sterol desaturase/sphingolipid hydroxylase (fatty acid hydroxylase superfamily)
MQQFLNAFQMPFDPSARIFWPFLIISLGVISIHSGKKGLRDFLSPSSLLDLKIMGINIIFKAFVFPLVLFSTFQVSVGFLKVARTFFPFYEGLQVDGAVAALLVTTIAFVINDFFRFFHHYLMHRLPFLRQLHRTHHSALVLTPFTLYRAHPLESLIAGFRNVLAIGLSLGIFSFLIQRSVTGLEVLGVNAFGFIFNACLSNLRHSSVQISFGPFEYFFISPRMHQLHHSNNPKHFGKNYGVALALWDQLFGSFYRPSKNDLKNLTFGVHKDLNQIALQEATTLKGALIGAFLKPKVRHEIKNKSSMLTSHQY